MIPALAIAKALHILKSRKTGTGWIEEIEPIICALHSMLEDLIKEEKEATEPIRDELNKRHDFYAPRIKLLQQIERSVKARLVTEYLEDGGKGTRVGNICFSRYPDFKIVDVTKISREYLKVNEAAINEAIKNGVLVDDGWEACKKIVVSIKNSES